MAKVIKVKSGESVSIKMEQGTRFAFTVVIREDGKIFNLTNYVNGLRGQLRRTKEKTGAKLADFVVSVVGAPTAGKLLCEIGATKTALISENGFFDIEVEDSETPDPDDVRRVFKGTTVIDLEVTDA